MSNSNFKRGIMYKIVCKTTNLITFGSTTNSLENRIKQHKQNYKLKIEII